ncbi:hypothetical protein L6452_39060 [Arctium lappa]|uniref:Uncharacterized protein n=1 Tax=Arctium lappa TaxID=4217 RepID=A0ACB8XRW3_ARCLA|nr:hypothetical protein L6452_39060 [Arctium lappa]
MEVTSRRPVVIIVWYLVMLKRRVGMFLFLPVEVPVTIAGCEVQHLQDGDEMQQMKTRFVGVLGSDCHRQFFEGTIGNGKFSTVVNGVA